MNIAFTEITRGGVTSTRATLTELGRTVFAATIAPDETLESFLYESPPGPEWPCGPSGQAWRHLCEFLRGDPDLRAAAEAALAASRHRYLAALEPETAPSE